MAEEDLEAKKLRLEIQKLSRPWYWQPEYLTIAVPIALAALALFIALISGFFDYERRSLKLEKSTLENEIESVRLEYRREKQKLDDIRRKETIGQVRAEMTEQVRQDFRDGRLDVEHLDESYWSRFFKEYERRLAERLRAGGLEAGD